MLNSIQAKLWALVIMFAIAMVAVMGVNFWGNQQTTHLIADISELTKARNLTADMAGIIRENRSQFLLTLQHNPEHPDVVKLHDHPTEFHLDNITKGREKVEGMWAEYSGMPIVKELLSEENAAIMQARAEYKDQFVLPTLALFKSGEFYKANLTLLNKGNPLAKKLLGSIDQANAKITEQVKSKQQKAVELTELLETLQIVGGILIMLAGLLVAWLFIRAIKANISELANRISAIAKAQKFDQPLPLRQDEFSTLVVDFNNLLIGLSSAFKQANHTVSAIANGDFKQRMSGDYVGDLGQLQQGVNASADQVDFMMSELEKVMQGLKEGKLDLAMDGRVAQSFRDLVDSSLHSMSSIISQVNATMKQMMEGDFNGRVTVAAAGEFQVLKDSINASMDSIAQAIESISEVVGAQAQGDLTKALPSGMLKGQLHDLKNAINYSSAKVKETVVQAVESSHVVSNAASQVSQGAADLSGRVQQQAAAVEQTSATMHQITSAVQANTDNANKVAELTREVQNHSNQGAQVMQQTIDAIKSIQQASSKIADIVSIIDSIAFQTNLLALNAAVEAARAGEHGRGFAVVASEVRALAGKSADAAKDIKGLIEDSAQRVDAGTQLADKSGEMLGSIRESIGEVAKMIDSITIASKEQLLGISQVNQSIGDIERVTQENAALVEETTAAAESLSHEASSLNDNMSFFKTGETSQLRSPSKAAHIAPQITVKTTAMSRSKPAGLPSPKANQSDEWSEF